MTNGDRIREMASTNDGLADIVSKYVGCNHCPVSSDCEHRQGVCEYTFKKWLNLNRASSVTANQRYTSVTVPAATTPISELQCFTGEK